MSWEAFIRESSPRYADWIKVFGSNRVLVTCPLPQLATVCDKPKVEIYLVALEAYDPELRERLITHLAEKFKLPAEEIERDLERIGLPILAEDVSVPIDMRYLM